VLRKDELKLWVERCEAQIGGVLDVLEAERAAIASPYWFGTASDMPTSRSPACCASPPKPIPPARRRALSGAGRARRALRSVPPFQQIVQPLSPPSGS